MGSQEISKQLRKWGGGTDGREKLSTLKFDLGLTLSLSWQVSCSSGKRAVKENERKWMWSVIPLQPSQIIYMQRSLVGRKDGNYSWQSGPGLSFSPQLTHGPKCRGPTCTPQSRDQATWRSSSYLCCNPIYHEKLIPLRGWHWPLEALRAPSWQTGVSDVLWVLHSYAQTMHTVKNAPIQNPFAGKF